MKRLNSMVERVIDTEGSGFANNFIRFVGLEFWNH